MHPSIEDSEKLWIAAIIYGEVNFDRYAHLYLVSEMMNIKSRNISLKINMHNTK